MVFDRKEYMKEYDSRPEIKAKKREYYYKNKEEISKRMKLYQEKNKDKIREQKKKYGKKYRQRPKVKERIKLKNKKHNSRPEIKEIKKEYEQRPKVKERRKKYWEEYRNKPKNKARMKEYIQKPENKFKKNKRQFIRRLTDQNYYLSTTLRNSLCKAIKKFSKTRKVYSSKKYGIDFTAIIKHLKPFPKDIENYHVDHIIPLSLFDFNNLEHIKKAFAPENHQWLTIKENLEKGNKLVMPH